MLVAPNPEEPVLEAIGDSVVVVDTDGAPVKWNAAAERTFGGTNLARRDWLEHRSVFDADGNALARDAQPLGRALHGEAVDSQEFLIRLPHRADAAWLDATAQPLRDDAGHIVGAVSVFREITERRRAEQALRESERLYRIIAQHLPSTAVFLVDRELKFLLADGESFQAAGYTPAQVEGKRCRSSRHRRW